MEAEYIEREALINEINLQKKSSKTSCPKRSFVVGDILTCIYTAPAADVVEVVRCGECENYSAECEGYGYCYYWNYEPGDAPNSVYSDEFCSHGKRRDG